MADQPNMRPLSPMRPPGKANERKRIGPHRLLLMGIILLQISGFTFLWMKISEVAPNTAGPQSVIDPATAIAAMKPPDEQLIRESIRTILKDELQTYVAQLQQEQQSLSKLQARQGKQPRAAATSVDDAPPQRPPASPQVAQQTMAIVDRALAVGVWTDADNNALLKLSPQLSEPQRIALLEKIFGAINRQQLKAVGSLPSL